MPEKLKPCPFCGGEAGIKHRKGVWRDHWSISCQQTKEVMALYRRYQEGRKSTVAKDEKMWLQKCCPMASMVSPKSWGTKQLAIEHWNSRPTEKAARKAVLELAINSAMASAYGQFAADNIRKAYDKRFPHE